MALRGRERVAQPHRLRKRCERLRRALAVDPGAIRVLTWKNSAEIGGTCQPWPCSTAPLDLSVADLGRQEVVQSLAVAEDERIEIDEGFDSLGDAVRRARDDAAAVRVAAEHDVGELLPTNQVHDVGDMRVESDLRRNQVRALPMPVSVGVNTSCPSACSALRTRFQHQLPCHAPCTRTNVAMSTPKRRLDGPRHHRGIFSDGSPSA